MFFPASARYREDLRDPAAIQQRLPLADAAILRKILYSYGLSAQDLVFVDRAGKLLVGIKAYLWREKCAIHVESLAGPSS